MKQLVLVIGAANPSTFGRVKVFQFVNDAGNIIAASSKNPTKVFQLTNGM